MLNHILYCRSDGLTLEGVRSSYEAHNNLNVVHNMSRNVRMMAKHAAAAHILGIESQSVFRHRDVGRVHCFSALREISVQGEVT